MTTTAVSPAAALDLEPILAEPLDWQTRWAPEGASLTVGAVGERGWNLLRGDLVPPALVLKESALAHNLDLMARYCRERGLSLAPHGKTTMAPQLFARQLAAGAWGMTAATAGHARVYRRFGVRRILLANEVVDPAALAWAAADRAAGRDDELYCLVDSLAGVELMERALVGRTGGRPLSVLVELGVRGGRTGCRDRGEAHEVAAAIAASRSLELAGVEAYEGLLARASVDESLGLVEALVRDLRALAHELGDAGAFAGREEVLVSVGGSAFFDRVAEVLGEPWSLPAPVRLLLRSGCYLTHDDGMYLRTSPFGERSRGERLRPALELWAAVLSRPEPGLAILGFGKRDAPYDVDLPFPRLVARDGVLRETGGAVEIATLNDQHAFVRVDPGFDLRVGDLVGCGVSHPCTSFDKWRLMPVVDDDYRVVDAVRTFF